MSLHIKNHSDSSQMIGKIDKSLEKKTFFDSEIFKIIRGMLLALLILFLCYHGPMQYSVLENGQILNGFSSRKTIMSFSLGYSLSHSIISAIATGMLIYSIIVVNNIILDVYLFFSNFDLLYIYTFIYILYIYFIWIITHFRNSRNLVGPLWVSLWPNLSTIPAMRLKWFGIFLGIFGYKPRCFMPQESFYWFVNFSLFISPFLSFYTKKNVTRK